MIIASDIFKASILIVDDQDANILLLEQVLRGAGYLAITSTKDPYKVCELHRQNRYSLILLDLQMPGMDGFQVMGELKAIETSGYLPVIVITAQPDHKLRALKAGAKDFISKPFELAEVLMRVFNMLEVRLLHQQAETRTEQAEAQFIEAQKMEVVGKLAGGVAHDFNNILAVILCCNDMITSDLDPKSPLRRYAKEIRLASERAAGLTRQLLVFCRKQTVQAVVLDLNDVVTDLSSLLGRLINENIKIVMVPGMHNARVKADAGYVGQVLMNLVLNARDAMPHGGKITIATENITLDDHYARAHPGIPPGPYVLLSVSDTGTGMSDAVKARLFEPFFTTKPLGKGTGLGLTTCQTIAQQSGGHIGVHSEVGKGTTFKIYFPRVEQPLEVATRVLPAGEMPRGTETLLVVEDSPTLRQLACAILEGQGYTVLSATNGREALNVVSGHKGSPIRLVFTDVVMPLMGGKAMADCLLSTQPELKVLFTSGYTDDDLLRQGIISTDVEFLPKPYTPATLASRVRELLDDELTPALEEKILLVTAGICDGVNTP